MPFQSPNAAPALKKALLGWPLGDARRAPLSFAPASIDALRAGTDSRLNVDASRDFGLKVDIWGIHHAMTYGTSLFLIAVGAILRYAVTATVSGVNLQTVGLVLIVVGIVGLLFSLLWFGAWARRRGVAPVEREVRDRDLY
jgi:hypothetical protein